MTTLKMQFAPHFQAPVTEDPMELTSEMDQRAGAGDDIDIDLDLTGNNPQTGEDEFMGEEDMNALADITSVDGQEAHAANDDEMADDSYAQRQVDEGSSVRDEDIEDAEYSAEPEVDEGAIVEPEIDLANEQFEEVLANYRVIIGDQNLEQDYQEQEYNEQEHHEHSTTPEAESGVVERGLPNGQLELVNPTHDVTEIATAATPDEYEVDVSKKGTVNHDAADKNPELFDGEGLITPEAKLEQVGIEVLPASPDLVVMALSNPEGSHTQEGNALDSPIRLHPVVLDYQGEEMFLFPPVDQNGDRAATFLLKDEQLAYSTIGDLLEACRCVLKQSLGEQDELMINIDDLDLHISESTIESASTRLSELVDLYVRLQQNDGLENPPPLYMDLTYRNRFSRRLDVLRNALIEGKGLFQLKSSQETEQDQQHRTSGDTDRLSHTAVLSGNETCASEQQPGEEAEESMEQYDPHDIPLPSENILLVAESAPQGTQSYFITDLAQEEHDRTEPLLGSDNNPHKVEVCGDNISEAAGSNKSPGPAQPLAGGSEVQKAEESIVDDGDFIDYEDVEELEGGTSSASSTLQGDAINVNALQDHAVPEEPIAAENQEHRSPHNVQEHTVANEDILRNFVDEKHTCDVGVPLEEEPNLAELLFQDSDDKGHSLSGQSNEEEKAPGNDEDASISQERELRPKLNAHDDDHVQNEAFAQYEDDAASYRHDTLQEHADQTEGDAYPVADTNLNGEMKDSPSTGLFQSKLSGSESGSCDDDLGRVNDLAAENELDEADQSLANDDNDLVLPSSEGLKTRPSFAVDGSAQIQEDDDEITYEDEEYDTDFPNDPAKAEHNIPTSPGSLKHARSLHEDDNAQEQNLPAAKRVRSG